MNFKSALGALRIVAILEGISFLSFLITMPLKYMMHITAPNKIVGMGHGVLFIAYVFLVFWASTDTKWSLKTKFWAYLASLLPFGTFVADAKIFKPTQESLKSI
jgi:integral membrane protein